MKGDKGVKARSDLVEMMLIVRIDGFTYYVCDHCHSIYGDLEPARLCEECCRHNRPKRSPLLERRIGFYNPSGEQKVVFTVGRRPLLKAFRMCEGVLRIEGLASA